MIVDVGKVSNFCWGNAVVECKLTYWPWESSFNSRFEDVANEQLELDMWSSVRRQTINILYIVCKILLARSYKYAELKGCESMGLWSTIL